MSIKYSSALCVHLWLMVPITDPCRSNKSIIGLSQKLAFFHCYLLFSFDSRPLCSPKKTIKDSFSLNSEKKKKIKHNSEYLQCITGDNVPLLVYSQPAKPQSVPILPPGPGEQQWCISACDKCAGRPYTHQATGNLLCSMPWNKQISGHRGTQPTKNKCLASNRPL